jgi:outer membrane protein assembly factor BamA
MFRVRHVLLALMVLTVGCAKPRPDKIVRRVRLEGTHHLRRVQILRGLETRRTGWWPFAEKHYYDPAVLDRDVRRIRMLYAANGFFEAQVVGREVKERPGGRAVDVRLTIQEGRPTHVERVDLEGLDRVEPRLRQELRRAVGIRAGQRFDHDRYLRAKRRLVQRLVEAGYAYAKAEGRCQVDRERRKARVELRVTPGPRVRFGPTRIDGNGDIPTDKLLGLVTWREGERYDPDEVARTRNRLFKQRLFASVSIKLPKQPATPAAVKIKVVPTKMRELRLGVGFGLERRRHEVRLSGRWTLRNFLGGMRTLELRLLPAFVAMPTIWDAERMGPAIKSGVKLTQPDVLDTGVTLYGSTGYELGIHEGYRFHGPGVQVGAERPFFRDHLNAGLSWNFQFFDFFDIVEEAFDIGSTALGLGFRDPYRLAWLEQFVRLDLRDHMLDPRAGLLTEVRLEEGFPQLGGEFTYFKAVPEVRGYIPVFTKRLVLALRAQLGYLAPREGQESPVTRRLALGGPTSHRGFTFGRLSPQSVTADGTRVPLGGNASLLGSADLRLRVVQLAKFWLSLVAFFDAGDVVAAFEDLELANLHLAAGGSLMYQTPIGSIRVGVGVRLNRLGGRVVGPGGVSEGLVNPDPGERIAFHLTIGEAF